MNKTLSDQILESYSNNQLDEGGKLKAVDYNKLGKGFLDVSLVNAEKYSGATYKRATDIGDLILFLNMASIAYTKVKSRMKK